MGSGPPPDPNALRRDRPSDRNGWKILPAKRTGEPPMWPLRSNVEMVVAGPDDDGPKTISAEDVDDREIEVWHRLWEMPQACAWEELGWTHDVALYTRWLVMAEAGDMKAASEARQWSDRLGLNPAAMLRNRWKVAVDQLAEKREEKQTPTAGAKTASARSRFRVVNGSGG
jgi:hypothetical protein